MEPIRVALVDDHALLRAGLKALLETAEDIAVVGEAASGEEALELVAAVRPDVVLMDLTMPGAGGLAATRRVTSEHPGTRVVVLTMHPAEEYLIPVLQSGGSGYITKDSADEELVEAIRTVAGGHVFLYPSAARLLLDSFRAPAAGHDVDPVDLLSAREREVLRGTAEGYTAQQIGDRLGISPKTVDTYRQRLMEKLHLRHRSELVQFALRSGMLQPQPMD